MAKRRFEQLELFPEKMWEIFVELKSPCGKIFRYSIMRWARTEDEAKNIAREAFRIYELRGNRIIDIRPEPLDDLTAKLKALDFRRS